MAWRRASRRQALERPTRAIHQVRALAAQPCSLKLSGLHCQRLLPIFRLITVRFRRGPTRRSAGVIDPMTRPFGAFTARTRVWTPTLLLLPLALRQPAGVSQGDELLFNVHRLPFRLDSGGEIRVVFRALVDGSEGAIGERHDYRPFFGSLKSASTALCKARSRFTIASGMSSRFFVMPSSRAARLPGRST
jgi:hypothetical protein